MNKRMTTNQIRAIALKVDLPVPLIRWRVMMGYPLSRIMEKSYG